MPKHTAERTWPMRHLSLIPIIGLVLAFGAGCSPFADDGSGGSGGASSSTNSTASSTASNTTSSTSSASTSGSTSASTGTGMTAEFFSCTGVPANHFVLKTRVSTINPADAIRVGGWIKYPEAAPFPCFQVTGQMGATEFTNDFGEVASGTVYTTYPGERTSDSPAACPGIKDGHYLCSTENPEHCNAELQGCYGVTSVGRYQNGVASDGLVFTANNTGKKVNPTFTTP